jgi:hypothetical protein
MNALKKVEKLFKSFEKKIQNPDSNLRPIQWKAHTLATVIDNCCQIIDTISQKTAQLESRFSQNL